MQASVNLDEILRNAKPWNFTITLDDANFRVRRLTPAEYKRLADVVKLTTADLLPFTLSLFEGGVAPGLTADDEEKTGLILGAIATYYQEAVLGKNVAAVREAIAKSIRR